MCWFLPYNIANQPLLYTSPLLLEAPSLPPKPLWVITEPGPAPCVTQQHVTGYLFTHGSIYYVDATLSVRPALSFPHCIHLKATLYNLPRTAIFLFSFINPHFIRYFVSRTFSINASAFCLNANCSSSW